MPDVKIPNGVLTVAGAYKPGDQAPHGAGLRQEECGKCGKWKYPHELSGQKIKWTALKRGGREVTGYLSVCNACVAANTEAKPTREAGSA